MGEIIALFGMVIIAWVLFMGIRAVISHNRRNAKWEIDERPYENGVQVVLVRGKEIMNIGDLLTRGPDFSYMLEERRSEAVEQAIALNHRRKLHG